MSKIEYNFRIGEAVYSVQLEAENVSCELFTFLVDISGMTNAEIASFIGIEPATISQWRRNKGISKAA